MKYLTVCLVAVALVAGPAAAQGSFGSKSKSPWSNGGASSGTSTWKPSPGYGAPVAGAAPAYGGATTSRTYNPPAAPKAEPFKPYQPYKPNSVFGPDRQKKR